MTRNDGIPSAWPAESRSSWWFTRSRKNMAKKKSASSRQGKRVPANDLFTIALSDKERRELRRLASKPDSQIDFSDAPEREPSPSEVHIARFYRPIKQLVSLCVDTERLA